jgi:hypothetical protein
MPWAGKAEGHPKLRQVLCGPFEEQGEAQDALDLLCQILSGEIAQGERRKHVATRASAVLWSCCGQRALVLRLTRR